MKTKRWTLGVVLAAAVSLWGLIEADASPFSSHVLTDDLSNQVNGIAPDSGNWDGSSDSQDNSGSSTDGSGSSADSGGKSNNGHGNNADGVDSSNPGQGHGGPNGAEDTSCTDPDNCVDDEVKGGSSTTSDSDSGSSNGNGNGKAKGKKK